MADRWHVNWLKEGVPHWNRRRKEVKFRPDLSGLDFREIAQSDEDAKHFFDGIDLKYANLTNASLKQLTFDYAQFYRADLSKAQLDGSSFHNTKFNQANLQDTSAKRCSFQNAQFKGAELARADFESSHMEWATFERSNLSTEQASQFETYFGVVLPVYVSPPDTWNESFIEDIDREREHRFSVRKLGNTPRFDSLPPSFGDLEANESEGTIYDVFYGTNRAPIVQDNLLIDYGPNRSKAIEYGICKVFIPKRHKIGSIGSPRWKRFFLGDDRLKQKEIILLNKKLFWEHVKEILLKTESPSGPTLFVHGFNNTFNNASVRAAQIGFDLGISSGIGMFSWPSAGKLTSYAADEAAMEASKYFLADFIEEYINYTKTDHLNVIAHSMGCRCFLLAAEVLSQQRRHVLRKIGQVVLAAADVDQGIMHQLAGPVVGAADRVTSYVSLRDRALEVSSWLHSYSRVGICPPVFVMSNMDTIVVNKTDITQLGHGYVADSRIVLSDIFSILKHRLAPSERFTIEEIIEGTISHWRLKE